MIAAVKSGPQSADCTGMKRMLFTIIGLAIVAGGALWFSSAYLKPHAEQAQAKEGVLSGAYDARLETCALLQDTELPKGIEPPDIGSDLRYLQVVVLFPEVKSIEGRGEEYVLDLINGKRTEAMTPVATGIDIEAEGLFLTLTYRTDDGFEHARLRRGKVVIVERVALR